MEQIVFPLIAVVPLLDTTCVVSTQVIVLIFQIISGIYLLIDLPFFRMRGNCIAFGMVVGGTFSSIISLIDSVNTGNGFSIGTTLASVTIVSYLVGFVVGFIVCEVYCRDVIYKGFDR